MSSSSLDAEYELKQNQILDRLVVELNSDYSGSVTSGRSSSRSGSVEGSINDDDSRGTHDFGEPQPSQSEQPDAAMDDVSFDGDDGTSASYGSEIGQDWSTDKVRRPRDLPYAWEELSRQLNTRLRRDLLSHRMSATTVNLYRMVSIAEAQETVLKAISPLPVMSVGLVDAMGYVLGKNVIAREPLPPFPASIKDGYAVVSSDGIGDYDVAFEALAGTAAGHLKAGTVAYITTGAPLPDGADAVVQIENTEKVPPGPEGQQRVRIVKPAKGPGDDVRALGSDIAAGEVVLAAGSLIGAAEIGLLATVGAATVKVRRKALVAVLSTGDELVEPDQDALCPGQIRDANRFMLAAAARSAGCNVVDLGIARDDPAQVEAKFQEALSTGVDVLITSGGVSVGDRDFIKPILERQGTVHFGKVRMKPGKPLTFATINATASRSSSGQLVVFGLPGNPVSSIVTFNLVVLPALRAMAGWPEPRLRRVHARTQTDIKLDPERPEYHRVSLHWQRTGESAGELAAASTGGQISSRLLSMRSANALLELPAAQGILPAGNIVSALLIDDLASMPVPEDIPMVIPAL